MLLATSDFRNGSGWGPVCKNSRVLNQGLVNEEAICDNDGRPRADMEGD